MRGAGTAAAHRIRDFLTSTDGRGTAERKESCAAGKELGRREWGMWIATGLDLELSTSDMFGRLIGGFTSVI